MGEDLGSVYYKLYNQVIFLHQRWLTYLELFATEKSRIELLNESGSFFFYIVQKGLFENVVMSISRISDSEVSMGHKNLTMRMLPKFIQNIELRNEIELQIKWHIEPAVSFAKELRNKRFGHEDFNISMGVSSLQEKSGIEHVEMALKSIRNLMNTIQKNFDGSTTIYKDGGHNINIGSLLGVLQNGKNAHDYLDKLRVSGEEPDAIFSREFISTKVRHLDYD